MSQQALDALAKVVLRRRHELGLTQQEVAELAGTSTRFLVTLERGKTTVQLDKLDAVLDVLGLELVVRVRA